MKNLVILKLGGSVITKKESIKPVFRKITVKRLCREIYQAKKYKKFNLILIHGAGSFGHPAAKQFRLNEGYVNEQSSIGITLTKSAVLELNALMINELTKTGINVAFVEPSAVVETNNGKIEKFNLSQIKKLLSKNITPVLSGDVVFDRKRGISILSGDQIATYLAKKLHSKKVFFASDVNGIYDKNPKEQGAKLIKIVNDSNYKEVLKQMKINNLENDVTGEMKGKLLSIHENLKGVSVVVTNGLKAGNLKNALLDGVNGTRILF